MPSHIKFDDSEAPAASTSRLPPLESNRPDKRAPSPSGSPSPSVNSAKRARTVRYSDGSDEVDADKDDGMAPRINGGSNGRKKDGNGKGEEKKILAKKRRKEEAARLLEQRRKLPIWEGEF